MSDFGPPRVSEASFCILSWFDVFSFTSSLVILVKLLPDSDILEKAESGKLDDTESLYFFIFLLATELNLDSLNLEDSKHLRFDLNIFVLPGSMKYLLWWPPARH